jgi:hypothetical protein
MGFELNTCQLCGEKLAPDDFDGICCSCDAEEEERLQNEQNE